MQKTPPLDDSVFDLVFSLNRLVMIGKDRVMGLSNLGDALVYFFDFVF
jgi:hypothetical protein